MTKTYAIIPARGGSKGVKGKNVRLLNGKPLIAYSIEVALATKNFDRVIVSTDSAEIADIAKHYGAELPFMRPSEFAQDKSSDRAYIEHALDWFRDNEDQQPDYLAILRPTTPLRESNLLDEAVEAIAKSKDATSLRSAHALAEPPQKMLQIENGWFAGFFPDDPRDDYFNLPRQLFPTAYHPNGYVDIVKTEYIRTEKEKIFGPRMVPLITPFSIEIDDEEDFKYLEYTLTKKD